ncbi:MAG: aminotransferase class I/II-fold pyridoxal phosphate-dependent enzyme [Deltaproteobacteria bacterium]
MNQNSTPLFTQLKKHSESNIIPFHVPGHKYGLGIKQLTEYTGENLLGIDLTETPDLDNLCNPIGVILESEKLCANLFDVSSSIFVVNGTRLALQAVLMQICKSDEKVLIPRNSNLSVYNGLVLSGAFPEYVMPSFFEDLSIWGDIKDLHLKSVITEKNKFKLLIINNPNCYGICSNLASIIELTNSFNIPVLADETFGAFFYLCDDKKFTSIASQSALAVVGMDSAGLSMPQAAILLIGSKSFNSLNIRESVNLLSTSSPSYILMASLDAARQESAQYGNTIINNVIELAVFIRKKLNSIPGVFAPDKQFFVSKSYTHFDETKLLINISDTGISGYKIRGLLKEKYNLSLNFCDLHNIVIHLTVNHTKSHLEHFANCLLKIIKENKKSTRVSEINPSLQPDISVCPREAFYSNKIKVSLGQAQGQISGETIVPIGSETPILFYGEKITNEVIDSIKALKSEECSFKYNIDSRVDYINVLSAN